jgi:hypothetical protein
MSANAKPVIFTKWAIAALLLLNACAPSRLVKPLKKGEQIVSGSFGGPLIKFSGAPIPLPFTTFSYAKGITDKISGFASLHSTSLLFGNLQTDLGICMDVYTKNKFGISITPAIQTALSFKSAQAIRLWPSLDANFRYEFTKGFLYAGTHSWFEFSKTRANDTKQERWLLPNYHIGFTKTNPKWNHQFEVKLLLPNTSIYPGVVDYMGINGKGAIGLYYCVTRKF